MAENTSDQGPMPIAIVGMACRGPGDAVNVESLYQMVKEGREAWGEIPKDRWNPEAFFHKAHRNGSVCMANGHFLKHNLAHFDAHFFGLTDAEAEAMDPQQRLLLECTYEALENGKLYDRISPLLNSKSKLMVLSLSRNSNGESVKV